MASPLDVAQDFASQPERMADKKIRTPGLGNGGGPSVLTRESAPGWVAAAMPGSADAKNAQVAEGTSSPWAGGVRRPPGLEQVALENNLEQVDCHGEFRTATLETRYEACEGAAQDQRDSQASKVLQDARVFVAGAVNEAQPQQSHRAEVRRGQQKQRKHLEELPVQSQKTDTRIVDLEHSPPTITRFWQRLEQMEEKVAKRQAPPGFDQPEECVRRSEPGVEEERASIEAGLRSPATASNVAVETVLSATGDGEEIDAEEDMQGSGVVGRKPKNRPNPRRRRERWIREQYEGLMEGAEIQPADYQASTTHQSFAIESWMTVDHNSSSCEGPWMSGLSGHPVAVGQSSSSWEGPWMSSLSGHPVAVGQSSSSWEGPWMSGLSGHPVPVGQSSSSWEGPWMSGLSGHPVPSGHSSSSWEGPWMGGLSENCVAVGQSSSDYEGPCMNGLVGGRESPTTPTGPQAAISL